jgi:hypothetical protein
MEPNVQNSEPTTKSMQDTSQLDFSNQTLPPKKLSKIFLLLIILAIIIVLGGVSVFAYQIYQKNKIIPVVPVTNTTVNNIVTSSITDITIKYIDTKGKLLTVQDGHYLSGENIYSPNPNLYYDGNPVLDKTMLAKNGYIDSQSLSHNGLHHAFVIAHYPHYPMMPLTNTHDLYIDAKKIKSLRNPIIPLVSDTGEFVEVNLKTAKQSTSPYSMISPNGQHSADIKNGKLFIDGKPVLPDITVIGINQFQITDLGHYLLSFSYIYSSDKYGKISKTSVYIDGKEYTSTDFVYGYINNNATHHLFYGSNNIWTLDDKPINFQGNALPYTKITNTPFGASLVEMVDNTIYVYKADKTYGVVDKIPEMPANIFNGLDDNISVILDKVDGIGSRNTAIKFLGKVINNSDWKEIYLNGAGGNTSSSELTMDNSQFFVLPPKLDPGQVISGELFSIAVSQVALPGDYNATMTTQGGTNQTTYDVMITSDVMIHIKP